MVPYKLAKVYSGEREWFVYYHYWSLSKGKYVRKKVRIEQRGLAAEDRQRLLDELCKELNDEMRKRNRRQEYYDESQMRVRKAAMQPLVDCLRAQAATAGIAESRASSFEGLATKLVAFYEQHPAFRDSLPNEIDERFLTAYRNYLQAEKYAGKTVNKHLWSLQAIGRELGIEIHTEPFRVKEIKNETNKYPPLTHEEKERAFKYFKEKIPGYHLMLLCQYYTCIRPAELHRLQLKNFDFQRNTIYIPWMDSKNGLSAYVQMFHPLKKALLDAGMQKISASNYLFGLKCQPSLEEYHGDWASKTWSLHRERMGMPAEKQPYGLKHTFNIDYVENNKTNIDWEFLRRHNRHATVQQTQEYISSLTAYFIDPTAVILDYT